MTRCTLLRPGTVDYVEALDLQRRTGDCVRAGSDESLILLQHPATYTLGARGNTANLLISEDLLAAQGVRIVRTDRGGDITYHGPGQVVGYPIINLRARRQGPSWYVRALEQTMIDALTTFGIEADRWQGRPGVWIDGEKVGAIGVRISGGVTTHGFALNVNTELAYFSHIIPCGIDAGVTSMAARGSRQFRIADVEDALASAFARLFEIELVEGAPEASRELAEVAGGR